MSVLLLDKTRKISRFLHNNNSSKVVFNDICRVFTDILDSSVLVISKKGKVLGESSEEGQAHISELITDEVGSFIDKELNERLLLILSTKENVDLVTLGFSEEASAGIKAVITPIDIAGERLGTLFLYRRQRAYDIDDIILSEYGTSVVGLEMMRSVNEEKSEEIRKKQVVKSAVRTLSGSEQDALIHVFSKLKKKEGTLVASKIADELGIARSIVVNALKKFESAGIIETRSSGMKGTYIRILNSAAVTELEKRAKE
ncbi:MAG: GTP-sensing pleiotropic transcriptional regulator CodY [Lachnospiraceae bacterium]|nr:GTP-sensing pleiotropic transcriptional regulator CodY [Lachnospiraceae bacterium]MBQ6258129.1 GTP-sensing pleiotropic transcriptional regulator CodY [Lachnospiraceae bacterium]